MNNMKKVVNKGYNEGKCGILIYFSSPEHTELSFVKSY